MTAPLQPPSARPRLGIAGIAIESSTFTPHRSGEADFEVRRGTEEILARYPFEAPEAEYVGILHARALPGGQLDRAVYEGWKAEIVEGLSAAVARAPLDGFFFDIHGAMSVVGLDDAEGDLITAIRAAIGPGTVVGTAMDLHGNVSQTLFEACDLLTCYRHAPHIDAWETRERGLRDLVRAAMRMREGGPRPHRALVHVPILLPGEKTSTRIEPAQSLYARIPEMTEREGVTDVSCWIGFAWADQPRCKAAVVAFGDGAEAVRGAALELATALWEKRHEFEFVAPTCTFEECLEQAITSSARPFWISDSGDNPGAGGADDTTHCLARLADRPEIRAGEVSALMVALVDPATTDAAWAAGVRGRLSVEVGGTIDAREPGPVPLAVEVAALDESGPTGRSAALRVLEATGPAGALAAARPTGLTVVVTARRSQWATRDMFARLDLSMTGVDVVTVKMGYLEPEQYEAAADWLLALTPGGVDQDLLRLGHSRIDRPMIPFDAEIPAPTAADVVVGGGRLVPTPEQLVWQRDGFGVFFHVGVNTFAGTEWSDGTLSPEIFDPSDLDADEWVRLARDMGAKYVVLTAKHHDGYCLWPTATTDYGPLYELWFDGAGSAGREYAWDRIGEVIDELQPGAMVFTMGPATIRWVGNEDGLAADPVQYVTASADLNNYDDEVVESAEARYLPPECDVSLRRGWFWQSGEEPKSLPHLLGIHDRSIGLGANLLLNIPPDRRGRIDPADHARATEFGQALRDRFGAPHEGTVRAVAGGTEVDLSGLVRLDHLELSERLEDGQRVTSHRILDADGQLLADGGTVGVRRIHRLAEPVTTSALRIETVGEGAVIEPVAVHDAGDAPVPDLADAYRAPTEVPES